MNTRPAAGPEGAWTGDPGRELWQGTSGCALQPLIERGTGHGARIEWTSAGAVRKLQCHMRMARILPALFGHVTILLHDGSGDESVGYFFGLLDIKMNSILRSLLVVVVLVCSSAFAAVEKFADADALGRWITYYYSKPEPHRVAEAIHAASAKGFMQNGKKAPPFIGFIAGVASKNPSIVPSLADQLSSLPVIDQPVLILGIWYSAYPETKPLLTSLKKSMPQHNEMIEYLLANGRPSLLELPLEQGPWVLDALWGYFMATGDDAPVARIITALPWVNIRGDVSRLRVGGAARWSLISNAIQHQPVMATCREELKSQPKQVADVLREVIAEAEKDMKEGKTQ